MGNKNELVDIFFYFLCRTSTAATMRETGPGVGPSMQQQTPAANVASRPRPCFTFPQKTGPSSGNVSSSLNLRVVLSLNLMSFW